MNREDWCAAVQGVAKSWTRLSDFTFTFHFHALEKEMATHSSVLALRIPGTGEPGGLLSMGSHRVGYDWSDLAAAAAAFHYVYVPRLLYPFICWWTFGLLPCLSYYKQWCCEHWGACIFSNYSLIWIYPGIGLLDHIATQFLFFKRNLHIVFHSGCNNL